MHSLQAACEEAERILHVARKSPQCVPHVREKAFFCIHQKLRELYEEETARDLLQSNKHLKSCSHLLDKLVKRYQLNTIIINLYPGNKGYSIGIRAHKVPGNNNNNASTSSATGSVENIIETMRWPYHEDELLRYIDNEELPPVLVDLLEVSNLELFYSGCVIAEVRDYRQAFPHFVFDAHHVLLRPTTQSLLTDVNLMTAEGDWSSEDRLLLESNLVLATQGPLCLDPSPAVSIINNRIQYYRHSLNTEPLRRCARKFSQVSVNRKRKLDQFTAHHDMPLYDFISRRRVRTRNTSTTKKPCENGLPPPDLTVPEGGVDVMRFARAYERPRETNDCTPQLVEEYILETDRDQERVYHIKLSILQRPSNAEYLGELYMDRDYREGERNGEACRFALGTRAQANRYIQQFTEIFTEEGRKSVRIKHVVPGQQPRVTCTAGMKERDARAAAAQQQYQNQQIQVQVANHVPHSVVSPPPTSIVNGTNTAQTCVATPPPQKSSSSTARHVTNPAISALVTSLMNSAQQFQQQAAAAQLAAAAAPAPSSSTGSSNNNTAIISLLNSNSPVAASNQKILAKKMTLNLLNSRLVNHGNSNSTAVQQPQPVRVTLSHPPSTTPTFTAIPGYSSVPISVTTTGASKQPVTLNHSNRVLNSTSAPRRLSDAAPSGSNLGLSMPGLSALLAGTPSADHPIPGSTNSASSLLERLTASSSTSGTTPPSPYNPSTPSPLSSPPQQSVNLNLQGLSLTSLQGAMASIPGLQNVQVSFPGLAVPISLSLNVSTSSGVIVPVSSSTTTCAASATSANPTMVLTNTPPGTTLSLPVAQLMTSSVKGLNQQNIRAVGPAASVSLAQGGGPSIQLVGTLQRPRGIVTGANKQTGIATRGILNTQRPAVTLTAQQQLQLALQKQAQLQQLCVNQAAQAPPQQPQPTISPAAVATKHRRRSNAADPNK